MKEVNKLKDQLFINKNPVFNQMMMYLGQFNQVIGN